ncbi:Phosphatidylinositide phosphatase SAC2 [Sparganum proliferum]
MEVRKTKRHFIITNGPCALFCDREDGSFKVGPVDLFGDIESARCLGTVEGVLGKFQCHPKNPWCLLLIRESVPACVLHDGVEIRRIVRIAMLSLTPESTTDFEINPCPKHADSAAAGADHCESTEPPAQPKIKNLIKNVADVVGLRGRKSSRKIRVPRTHSEHNDPGKQQIGVAYAQQRILATQLHVHLVHPVQGKSGDDDLRIRYFKVIVDLRGIHLTLSSSPI